MKLDSSNPHISLPDHEQASVLRLGLENYSIADWIFTPNDLNTFLRHKNELNSLRGRECYAESPSSAAAQFEFHGFLLRHLIANKNLGYAMDGRRLTHETEELIWEMEATNLLQASLWVPEDFCILEKKEDEYLMTAASVHSPSNWVLREKIEQTVDFIHEPVPGYDRALSERVNRFLSSLKTDRVFLRYNWSVQAHNELFWRDDLSPPPPRFDDNDPFLYWRIERQTFIRLPKSGAIVFGIRIFLHSFESLRKISGFEQSIRQLLDRLPAEQKHYKGLTP